MQSARLGKTATTQMNTRELILLTADLRQTCNEARLQRALATKSRGRILYRLEKLDKLKCDMRHQESNKSSSGLCKLVEDAVQDGEQHVSYTHSGIVASHYILYAQQVP